MKHQTPSTPPPDSIPPRRLFSVRAFAERNPSFGQPTLRDLIFRANERYAANGKKVNGNGLIEAGAVLRCGRKVLIDEERFFSWLDRKNSFNAQAN